MVRAHAPEETVAVGSVLVDKYRVEEILGHGGMGVVAKCTHLQLHDTVAVKMLRRDVLSDRESVERFMREAQAAVKLRSEYVARVSDVGMLEDGVPYMVMEYLDGHDLGALIAERGYLPSPWASELMLQAAEALAEAHSIGIVHRDVKPTNLFVTWRPDGSALIKVLDFGISKAPMGTDMELTQTQSLLGTPAYMSPEQMRSARTVDARSDIWSLGTVMYELLEGRRPFEAESFSEMCVKVAVDEPLPMTNAPVALQRVVLRCLAKSPDQRYPSMAELGRDLIPFAQDAQRASMIVERMLRTLGQRGLGDWNARTSGARALQVVALGEGEVVQTPIGSIHEAIHGSIHGQVTERIRRPVAPPTELRTIVDRKRRNWLWPVLGIAAAAGIAIGVVSALAVDDDAPAARAPIATPAPVAPTPTTTPPPAPVEVPAVPATPDDTVAADERATEDKKPATRRTPPRRPAQSARPAVVEPAPAPAKPAADCDVYKHPHGCPTS